MKFVAKRLVEVALVEVEKLEKRLKLVEEAEIRPPENVRSVEVALLGNK